MNAPILSRTLLYERLRDGTIRLLDFALVTTSLGAMVEPRTLIRATGAMKNEDPYDSGYTDLLQVQTDAMFAELGFLGEQWPRVFNSL